MPATPFPVQALALIWIESGRRYLLVGSL